MEERTLSNIDKRFSEGERLRVDSLKGLGVPMHSHHYHNFYEIYYMVDGKGSYFINDKIYDIVPGDLVIVPPNTIHSTDYGNMEYERILLEFSENMIPKQVVGRIKDIPNLYRHPGISRDIYLILKDITKEYNEPDEFSSYEINYLICHLLFLLLRNTSAVKVVHSRDAVISEVVAFIRENYQTNISLQHLAEMHFISPEHLSRSFKKETNFGFSEFISIVRLQKAEHLLKEHPEMSISEVAYACGFNDSNYFSDKFKRTYGISPLRYGKSFKSNRSVKRPRKNKENKEKSPATEDTNLS